MFNETALACALHLFLFLFSSLLPSPKLGFYWIFFLSFFFFLACDWPGQRFAVFWLICCALFLLTDALPLHFVKLKRSTEVNEVSVLKSSKNIHI